MLTGRRSLTKIFPDSVSKYERDAERKGGERAMPLNSSIDILTERKVGPSWQFLGGESSKVLLIVAECTLKCRAEDRFLLSAFLR